MHGMMAGSLAGAAAKTCTAPFDRVRILCQAGTVVSPLQAARHVLALDGVAGFWRGNLANLLRIVPNRGVLFMCSDFFKDLFRGFPPHGPGLPPPPPLTPLQYVGAGSLSGAVTVVATYPLDLVRGRLASSIGAGRRFTGIVQTVRAVVAEEGPRALYRGMGTSLAGAFPYEGIRFGVYDVLKAHYLTPESPLWLHSGCGVVASLASATLLFPNDTVRRRMQVQVKAKTKLAAPTLTIAASSSTIASAAGPVIDPVVEPHHRSGWACYKYLFRTYGISVFYRGLSANVIRAAPSAAIQFATFEFLKRHFSTSSS